MKNFWILIITATLLSLPYRSSSSTERFRLLDTGNGLFNNQVRFLTQMEDGKILVCTEGMFNVYNGNSFEPLACDLTYTVPLGMHNLCTSYDGGNGLLWAKDFYRLYLINTRTGRFCHDIKERFEAARLTEAFNDFILDHDRNAWIITESGKLYRYDWKKPAKQVYEPRPEEKSRGIRVKEVMQAGPFHLIFLNTGRMLVWEEKSGRIVGEDSTVATPAPSEYFRTAWLQADKEHLLISVSHTEGYLYLYNIYTREWKEILKGRAINDIKKCKDGCFWLGGNQTLIKLSPRFELLQETHRLGTDRKRIRYGLYHVGPRRRPARGMVRVEQFRNLAGRPSRKIHGILYQRGGSARGRTDDSQPVSVRRPVLASRHDGRHLPVRHGPQKLPGIPLRIRTPLLYRYQKRPGRCILVQHPARTIQNTGQ